MVKHARRMIAAAFALLLCITMIVSCLPGASAWSGTPYYSPSSAYPGQYVTFEVDLKNTGSSSLDIQKATLSIDWGTTTTERTLTGAVSVAPGARGTVSAGFTVPQVSAGVYTARLSITAKAVGDLWADENSYNCAFTVKAIEPLTVTVQADKTSGSAPMWTSFESTVTGGVGPYSYEWTLGDGSSESASQFSHRYTKDGSYTATLVVKDSMGRSASDSVNINVQSGVLDLGGSLTHYPGIILVVAIVAAAIISAVVIIKRKQKARPPVQ